MCHGISATSKTNAATSAGDNFTSTKVARRADACVFEMMLWVGLHTAPVNAALESASATAHPLEACKRHCRRPSSVLVVQTLRSLHVLILCSGLL